MFYALLNFLIIVGGTYMMYQALGKSAGAADVQRVKDRLKKRLMRRAGTC